MADAPAYGFGSTGKSWLPQPESFAALAVDQEDGVPGSTLEFYRAAISLRRERGLGDGSVSWLKSTAHELSFENRGVQVIVNFGPEPIALPDRATVLLASDDGAIADGSLLPNRAVWLDLE